MKGISNSTTFTCGHLAIQKAHVLVRLKNVWAELRVSHLIGFLTFCHSDWTAEHTSHFTICIVRKLLPTCCRQHTSTGGTLNHFGLNLRRALDAKLPGDGLVRGWDSYFGLTLTRSLPVWTFPCGSVLKSLVYQSPIDSDLEARISVVASAIQEMRVCFKNALAIPEVQCLHYRRRSLF
ncbi:hypothetical protein CEXT_728601 [Caerostris extrusa]|uniref:Uncharacterized protein n=1 Tax=Caerostris extrusa TaxID=172846 RepID=A0AAV4NEQ6_CAEEX|nr:hypothetical protein CEXT_728601 [Caerostris extrusa]